MDSRLDLEGAHLVAVDGPSLVARVGDRQDLEASKFSSSTAIICTTRR